MHFISLKSKWWHRCSLYWWFTAIDLFKTFPNFWFQNGTIRLEKIQQPSQVLGNNSINCWCIYCDFVQGPCTFSGSVIYKPISEATFHGRFWLDTRRIISCCWLCNGFSIYYFTGKVTTVVLLTELS